MLTPSDEAFIAGLDLPSLRLTAEQVAEPRCDAAADMRDVFVCVPADYRGTRVALGQEIAKAADLVSIVGLLRLLEKDPEGTLQALGRAVLLDPECARPTAPTQRRANHQPAPPRPGMFAQAMAHFGRAERSPSAAKKKDVA